MAVAFVAQRFGYNAAAATSHSIPVQSPTSITTGNHLILALIAGDDNIISGITDPRGNTWQMDGDFDLADGTSSLDFKLFSCKVTTPYQAADNLTVTFTGADSEELGAIGAEFSGLHATTWLSGAANNGGNWGTTPWAWAAGAAPAAASGDLEIGAIGGSSTVSGVTVNNEAGGAWTLVDGVSTPPAVRHVRLYYRLPAGAETPNFDGNGASDNARWGATTALYVQSGGGGGGAVTRSFAVIVGQ